jgi:hypothetical protein
MLLYDRNKKQKVSFPNLSFCLLYVPQGFRKKNLSWLSVIRPFIVGYAGRIDLLQVAIFLWLGVLLATLRIPNIFSGGWLFPIRPFIVGYAGRIDLLQIAIFLWSIDLSVDKCTSDLLLAAVCG